MDKKNSTNSAFIYSLPIKTIAGDETTLAPYAGKLLLMVNTASRCMFTKQYAELEALYQRYHKQGLMVLGFPCNQFGAQEPGSGEEIKNFCANYYHISFPIFDKICVNGAEAHPLFQYLQEQCKGIFNTAQIKWNFTKFLVDSEGRVIKRFAPLTSLRRVEAFVKKHLNKHRDLLNKEFL